MNNQVRVCYLKILKYIYLSITNSYKKFLLTFKSGKWLLHALIFLASIFLSKIYAQTISYYKDASKSIDIETVNTIRFNNYSKTINDGSNHANYWIKIDDLTAREYVIQLPNSRLTNVKAFQKNIVLKQQDQERFSTYVINGPNTVYLKIDATKESYIPVTVDMVNDFQRKEKTSFLFIGFYIGFVILIFFLNIFYAFNFDDRTYSYYAFFLLSSAIGILISDGLFSFLNLSDKNIDILETINNLTIGFFAVLFINHFSQINSYLPKFRFIPFSLLFLATIVATLFLITDNFSYYIALECFIFLALTAYWICGIILFNKSNFIKITLFAYSVILLFAIDFYLTKLFGISLMNTTPNALKIGSIFEMSILSIAVIYRVRLIHAKNREMRSAIEVYTKELKTLSNKIRKDEIQTIEKVNLSFRETEIIELISQGKTNKEIAHVLNISENTVKYHVKNIYTKLNIKSRKEVLTVIKES